MSKVPLLTRVMVLAGWVGAGSALAVMVFDAPEGTAACLLVGASALLGLRAHPAVAWWAGLLVAALFSGVALLLAVSRADPAARLDGLTGLLFSPALRQPGAWLPGAAGAALVLGSTTLGTWAASGLDVPAGPPERPVPGPSVQVAPLVRPRAAGLRCLEGEISRAAAEMRCVSVALLMVDGTDQAERGRVMRMLDETVVHSLMPSDAVSEYGPAERLVVLPGVSSPALRAGATQLCIAAAERVGRPVRAALATFPTDGATPRCLLDRLERAIDVHGEPGGNGTAAG
ncbi:MAG TPA: hypothetical protein VGO86_14050 [Candidatus Dormibacteraeota bacterium]